VGAISICRFEWQVVTDEVVLLQRALSTGSLQEAEDMHDNGMQDKDGMPMICIRAKARFCSEVCKVFNRSLCRMGGRMRQL
jgi:hypothetical protein